MKKFLALLLALLVTLSLCACGASSNKSATLSYADAADADLQAGGEYWNGSVSEEAKPAGSHPDNAGPDGSKRLPDKIIYTANYDLETTTFDDSAAALQALVESMGGYFESRSQNNYRGYRSGDYTVRIPADKYADFCAAAGDRFHVTYFTENAQDISETYYDTQSRLDTARIKLERLQTLLKQARSMEDIITIENAISDVEYTVEALSGTLKHYDAQVDYATVYLSLQEVYQLSDQVAGPMSFGEKLADSFRSGLRSLGRFGEELVMFLAYAWVYLAAIAVIAVAVIRTLRRRRDKKRAAKTPPVKDETPKE